MDQPPDMIGEVLRQLIGFLVILMVLNLIGVFIGLLPNLWGH